MDCSRCEHYNKGKGQPACLKCKRYKELQMKSVKRETIKTEHLPQAVIENIADPRTRSLMDIICQLPIQYAVPLMMRATLNMTIQEIANYHRISKQAVDKKISQGMNLIKKSLLDG